MGREIIAWVLVFLLNLIIHYWWMILLIIGLVLLISQYAGDYVAGSFIVCVGLVGLWFLVRLIRLMWETPIWGQR